MFDSSLRAAASIVVISGVTVSVSAGATSAAPAPDQARTVGTALPERSAPSTYCVIRALPLDVVRRGARSEPQCGGTLDEAETKYATTADASGGLVTAMAQENEIAIHYADPWGYFGSGAELHVRGDCNTVLPSTAPIDNDLSATWLIGCSSTKMYKGYNFTGDFTSYERGLGDLFSLQEEFDNQIRSVTYGA